mgnify:CR=1 FL=1
MGDLAQEPSKARTTRHVFDVSPEDRERIRCAVLEAGRTTTAPTLTRVQQLAGIRRTSAATVLKVFRAGCLDPTRPWHDGSPSLESARASELLTSVSKVQTHEDCNEVLKRLAGEALKGSITPAQARTARECLSELRQNMKAAREAGEASTEQEPVSLVSPDVYEAVRILQGIVSDELRAAALEFVASKAREDRERFPNPAPGELDGGEL